MSLPLPTSQITEIISQLIYSGKVSCFDFPYMGGYRTRISELKNKHDIPFKTENRTHVSKYGNSTTYHLHRVKDKKKLIELYNKLNKIK